MGDKIEFSIPGFYMKTRLNEYLLTMYKNQRYLFNDDIEITSCYDSFPCSWNGGRRVFGEVPEAFIINTIKFYNSLGISLRYTFTNCLLDKNDLYDRKGNSILRLTKQYQTVQNGINLNLPILEKYIKKDYKDDFYYLTSTTLGKTDIDEINKLSKTSIVIPDYSLNNKFDIIKQFKNKENIEFLVAETCSENCPFRKEHYEFVSRGQLGEFEYWDKCPESGVKYYDSIKNKSHSISIEDIRKKYVPLGFTKFKIAGRGEAVIDVIEKYINYLIKPEYQNIVRNELLIEIIGKSVNLLDIF